MVPPPDLDPHTPRPWTWIVYDQSDFENAFDLMEDVEGEWVQTLGFAKQVRSGENLNVLVLIDRVDAPAFLVRIDESHSMDTVQAMGELNMGDSETLSALMNYVKEHFPAQRYILSIYGHGGGWRGSCRDFTSGNDILTMGEMKSALARTGGVDLALFNAPCLMGNFEAAYNLRDQVDVYVASENLSGWVNRPMKDLSEELNANPGISTQNLGALALYAIWEHRMIWEASGWDQLLTMSAIRTEGLDGIREALDDVSGLYLGRVEHLRTHLDAVRSKITQFQPSFVDLYDLAEELLAVETDSETVEALQALRTALKESVIAEIHGPGWDDTHGLSIFLPDTTSAGYMPQYQDPISGLDFVQDARWDELMGALLDTYGPEFTSSELESDRRPPFCMDRLGAINR